MLAARFTNVPYPPFESPHSDLILPPALCCAATGQADDDDDYDSDFEAAPVSPSGQEFPDGYPNDLDPNDVSSLRAPEGREGRDAGSAGLGESLFDPETSSLLLGALVDQGIEPAQVRVLCLHR